MNKNLSASFITSTMAGLPIMVLIITFSPKLLINSLPVIQQWLINLILK